MNKNAIKTYAIWARNELISRVSQKAYEYGVEKENSIPFNEDSIRGVLLSSEEKNKRQQLIREIRNKGYDQVIEEVAYTWFNRFIALRYMEVNNYLPNKVRLFTNENNEFKPQIIEEALHIDIPGLDKNKVFELKEANNHEELYKELLLAACNDMSLYLPGMFKPISDYMTLLFPNNLLREESVLGRLISDIDEDSWTDQVQIIGWLYQYYNTEPKDKVYARKSGEKIKKEEIPAVTQLFTPDWIVRYMTENSLGRLWLDGHEDKGIKTNWKYYLDEAEQEPDVQKELDKIKAEHAKLTPTDIKFLDPCMGSGHILVYAFDVFMQIYVSEGWTEREAAVSILKNNLFGLDIDERAYQLSYFALMMKARQYNRRILSENIAPNVMAIEESNTFKRHLLNRFGKDLQPLATRLVDTFIDAKEYGSILNVEFTKEELDSLQRKLDEIYVMSSYGDLLSQSESDELVYQFTPLLKQAKIMVAKYDCVVTNPPYQSISGCSDNIKNYVINCFPDSKSDLFSVFIEKCMLMTKQHGYQAMITQHAWMFLGSYERLRSKIYTKTIINMAHLGSRAFEEISGEVVQTTSFVLLNDFIRYYLGTYERLTDATSQDSKEKLFLRRTMIFCTQQFNFSKLPGHPVAYWVKNGLFDLFASTPTLASKIDARIGMVSGDNDRFLRLWHEVPFTKIEFNAYPLKDPQVKKWYPLQKGGSTRHWYGNHDYVVNWENDGYEIKNDNYLGKRIRSHNYNGEQQFKEGITWNSISTTNFCCRYSPKGFTFDAAGPLCEVKNKDDLFYVLAMMTTKVTNYLFAIINPTINFPSGYLEALPIIIDNKQISSDLAKNSIEISQTDWDSFETSWDFSKHPLIVDPRWREDQLTYNFNAKERHDEVSLISVRYERWKDECEKRFSQLKSNEEELNRIFIDIYGLQDELTPEVEDKDVTVRKADLTREIKSLISYAVGCMFGRYSLDTEGLAYAGGEWDSSKYRTYIPDSDNILPITDDEYFEDDIVSRFINFIKVTYGEDTLEENLKFISDALGGKGSPREVIRNYFLNDFFKDHCNTYQVTGSGKRPIYWQFDSGKKNGFKALMYIHRYTPDLIARMRTSYIHELQSKYNSQISLLEGQIDSAASTSDRVKLEKQLKKIKEQAEELRVYEEKVHHYADMMTPMDLDDGVKVNYAKFEELLTKIK